MRRINSVFRTGGRFASFAVAAVYLAMLFISLRFVFLYAVDLPFYDEWDDTLPTAMGVVPYSWEWLWGSWNEHRIVIPRLLQHGILYLSGDRFIPVMYFNICLAGAASLLLWRTAVLLRERFAGVRGTSLTDAFFPLALLHTGHWENITAGFQVQFYSTVLLCALLLYVGLTLPLRDSRGHLYLPRLIALTVVLLSLGLTGGNGLVFVPFGGLYLIGSGVADLRRGWNRNAAVGVVGGASTLLLCVLYFVGRVFATDGATAKVVPLWVAVQCALNYLLMGFGHGATPRWDGTHEVRLMLWFLAIGGLWGGVLALQARERSPASRLAGAGFLLIPAVFAVAAYAICHRPTVNAFVKVHMLFVPLLGAFALWGGVPSLRRGDDERRQRLLFLAVFVLGALGAAAGIAKARAGLGEGAGLSSRYGLMAAQLLIAFYFAGLLTLRERFVYRYLPAVLFTLSLLFLWDNRILGKQWGEVKRRILLSFLENAARGLPLEPLAVVGTPRLSPVEASLIRGVRAFRRARRAPFDRVPDGGTLVRREVSDFAPRKISGNTSDAAVRIALGAPVGSGRVRAVVVGYVIADDSPVDAGYRFVGVRRDAASGALSEQGGDTRMPHSGNGAIAIQPNGLCDFVQISPLRDGANKPPSELTVKRVIVFYEP